MFNEKYRTYSLYRLTKRSATCEDGCIIWQGARNKKGYGLFSLTVNGIRRMTSASRASYMLHNNVILDDDEYVMHKCDTPPCINPAHLVRGNPVANTQDCIQKGRRAKSYCKHSRVRKFTKEEIDIIRNSADKPKVIAARLRVSLGYISKIRANKAKTF